MPTMEGMKPEQQQELKRDLGVIGELLALPSVAKHDTRFENEVALVAPTAELAEVCAVVERHLPPPVKPADQSLPQELEVSDLLDAMGGVQKGQTLYLKRLGEGLSLYVAYWPWGGGERFTIKIGVHVKTA